MNLMNYRIWAIRSRGPKWTFMWTKCISASGSGVTPLPPATPSKPSKPINTECIQHLENIVRKFKQNSESLNFEVVSNSTIGMQYINYIIIWIPGYLTWEWPPTDKQITRESPRRSGNKRQRRGRKRTRRRVVTWRPPRPWPAPRTCWLTRSWTASHLSSGHLKQDWEEQP